MSTAVTVTDQRQTGHRRKGKVQRYYWREINRMTFEGLARWLEGQEGVARVWYPGLESHPQRAVAERQFALGGGMFGLELQHGLQLGDRLLGVAQPFVGESELEVERRDRRIELVGLFQRFERLFGPALAQVSATHEVVSRGRVAIGLQDLQPIMRKVQQLRAQRQSQAGEVATPGTCDTCAASHHCSPTARLCERKEYDA